MEYLDSLEVMLQILYLVLVVSAVIVGFWVYFYMKKERNLIAQYPYYIVVWENPRRIQRCKVVNGPMIDKDQLYRLELPDGMVWFRYPHQIFSTLAEVERHLEIEDYRSVH